MAGGHAAHACAAHVGAACVIHGVGRWSAGTGQAQGEEGWRELLFGGVEAAGCRRFWCTAQSEWRSSRSLPL